MEAKTLVLELIEEERKHLKEQEIGTDEYDASLKRLVTLEGKLAELEQLEKEDKDKKVKNIIEVVKVGCGVVIPLIGLVCITASEKEITFTGALKEYTRLFIPKKLF